MILTPNLVEIIEKKQKVINYQNKYYVEDRKRFRNVYESSITNEEHFFFFFNFKVGKDM